MRGHALSVLLLCWACWATGCSRPSAVSVTPTDDELPRFEQNERVLPVSVAVEGRRNEPTRLLVLPYTEPELTAEEKEALGIQPEPINWLEFYKPLPSAMLVSRDTGGAATSISGLGGVSVGLTTFQRPAMVGAVATPIQAVHGGREKRFGNSGQTRSAVSQGPRSTVQVTTGGARRVAAHETHAQP